MTGWQGFADDAAWHEWRNYANSVSVNVRVVGSPIEEDGLEEWFFHAPDAPWAQDWIVRQVKNMSLLDREEGGRQFVEHSPSILTIREQHFDWGAESAAYQIILWLAQWAATSATWDAFKALAHEVASRLKGEDGIAPYVSNLSESEVVARCEWLLNQRYDIQDDLELRSIETTYDGIASVAMRDSRGVIYDCDFQLVEGLLPMMRCKRTFP